MRVRWGNAGRAAVVLAVLALAVAWPRLAPPAPRLPGDGGIPVATPTPGSTPQSRPERPRRKPVSRPERPRRHRMRSKPAPRPMPRRAPRPPARRTPAPPAPAARPTAAPPPTFHPQDPATQEFSFESG